MARIDLNNLAAFMLVARERSFTRAAAQLGVTQSALSHTVRGLGEKLGIRLLTRTTRGVSPTEAGERLLANLGPYYEGIEAEQTALTELRDKPAGTIRITAAEYAATTILWPKLAQLLPNYPDIKVEISINYGLVDIVEVIPKVIALGGTLSLIASIIFDLGYFLELGISLAIAPMSLEDHASLNVA